MVMIAAIACMSCAYVSVWKFTSLAISSNFVQGMKSAFTGSDVTAHLEYSLTETEPMLVCKHFDLGFLLLLSGIEPNPGPDEIEKISKEIKELRKDIKEDLRKEREEADKRSTMLFDQLFQQITAMTSLMTRLEDTMTTMERKIHELDAGMDDLHSATTDLNARFEEVEN